MSSLKEQIDYLIEWIERDKRCYELINFLTVPTVDEDLERKATLAEIQSRIRNNTKKLYELTRKGFIEAALMKT